MIVVKTEKKEFVVPAEVAAKGRKAIAQYVEKESAAKSKKKEE